MLKFFCFSTPKRTSKLTYNTKLCFFLRKNKKKFNIHTSYLELHCITFSEQFFLGIGHTKKKEW